MRSGEKKKNETKRNETKRNQAKLVLCTSLWSGAFDRRVRRHFVIWLVKVMGACVGCFCVAVVVGVGVTGGGWGTGGVGGGGVGLGGLVVLRVVVMFVARGVVGVRGCGGSSDGVWWSAALLCCTSSWCRYWMVGVVIFFVM